MSSCSEKLSENEDVLVLAHNSFFKNHFYMLTFLNEFNEILCVQRYQYMHQD